MYLWPTVAETAVHWKDHATATIDLGLFWCLPPLLPVARQHWQSQHAVLQTNPHSTFSAHTVFHHGFNYSWLQLNGWLFLHWNCIYCLLKATLVITINLSCFWISLFPVWLTHTEIALWNTVIFWMEQKTLVTAAKRTAFFDI